MKHTLRRALSGLLLAAALMTAVPTAHAAGGTMIPNLPAPRVITDWLTYDVNRAIQDVYEDSAALSTKDDQLPM